MAKFDINDIVIVKFRSRDPLKGTIIKIEYESGAGILCLISFGNGNAGWFPEAMLVKD